MRARLANLPYSNRRGDNACMSCGRSSRGPQTRCAGRSRRCPRHWPCTARRNRSRSSIYPRHFLRIRCTTAQPRNGLPALTSLIVDKTTGLPSSGLTTVERPVPPTFSPTGILSPPSGNSLGLVHDIPTRGWALMPFSAGCRIFSAPSARSCRSRAFILRRTRANDSQRG
jgi:hypothetical protein